jgi:Transposase IS66 family
MWQYGSPSKGVVFDFRMGRDSDGPKQFLGEFEGLLQTDGYQGYNVSIRASAPLADHVAWGVGYLICLAA